MTSNLTINGDLTIDGTITTNAVNGDLSIDADSGKVMVWSENGNGWIEAPATKTQKDLANDYLRSLGIRIDIDTILAEKYPEHLI